MSFRDFETYAGIAREFRFHRMRPTFATNSIKLCRAASKGRQVPYLWFDPPWQAKPSTRAPLAVEPPSMSKHMPFSLRSVPFGWKPQR